MAKIGAVVRPAVQRWLDRLTGAVLIGFGVLLACIFLRMPIAFAPAMSVRVRSPMCTASAGRAPRQSSVWRKARGCGLLTPISSENDRQAKQSRTASRSRKRRSTLPLDRPVSEMMPSR